MIPMPRHPSPEVVCRSETLDCGETPTVLFIYRPKGKEGPNFNIVVSIDLGMGMRAPRPTKAELAEGFRRCHAEAFDDVCAQVAEYNRVTQPIPND